MNAKLGKEILVDGTGRTVYLYEPDGANTESQVAAGLKSSWPAVTAPGAPAVGSGLDETKVSVQTQSDGAEQVMYNSHLLYLFAGDAAPGDANGQELGGNWFALTPAGEKIS